MSSSGRGLGSPVALLNPVLEHRNEKESHMTSHILPTEELTRLVASSNTEDHRKLAKHYTAHAADHESDAKAHEALAKQYEKTSPGLAGEARHYAAHSMEAAEALRNLAAQHQQAAN
jgi:hypothetical protein